jgi:hypothetical protein
MVQTRVRSTALSAAAAVPEQSLLDTSSPLSRALQINVPNAAVGVGSNGSPCADTEMSRG